ncbi:MAG: NAD(P)H-quinone oxidoreductase [Acidobacteriaceae bacterium]|nr:NAD(P)H-quinone oxidoreductase [Acidobacteriaceae bacterium]
MLPSLYARTSPATTTMIAIEITSFGGPDVLKAVERPKPVPQAKEVVICVEAAGVARADILQREGKYPPPAAASDIPGLDVAGTIDSAGSGVTEWKAGDRVCAILAGGGYAEFCVAPALQVLPIPENWTAIEAVALPENMFTVYDNLVTRAGLKQGETVLIHGGTSGIGVTAIMLSRACRATPIATAGSDEKCRASMNFGAEHSINYKGADFVSAVRGITGERGVDLVLDIVGGAYLERNLDCLAHEGRLVIIATQRGRTAELDIAKLMTKRGRIMGSTMRARTPEQKGMVRQRLLEEVWPLLPAKNPIRPVIDSTFSLLEARLAHERMESGAHIGKIVLTTDSPGGAARGA